ncbi:MAG: aldo/keto reductase [Steroidobacteraceae bacterium]
MNRRRLGNTKLEVSGIGLGCQSLGGGLYYRDDREAMRVLHRAADAGINFFDTADHYSLGQSEALIGKAFKGRRGGLILSTKVGTTYSPLATAALRARPLLRPFNRALRGLKLRLHHLRAAQRRFDFSAAYVAQAVENCLRRLRTDFIDLLMLHKPPLAVLERGEAFAALARLQAAGKIRYFGVSCDGVEEALAALCVPGLSAIQVTVSLLDQSAAADVLPMAQRLNCGVIARNPRGQGHLTSDYRDLMAETYVQDAAESELREQAARQFSFLASRRTLAQAAIQFAQHFSAVSVVLPRVVNLRQLEDVLGTPGAPALTPEELARIAAVTQTARHLLKSHPYR